MKLDYPYTPAWAGNRKSKGPFTVTLNDIRLSDLTKLAAMSKKVDAGAKASDYLSIAAENLPETLKRAVAGFSGLSLEGKVIESVDDFLAADPPVDLVNEIADRWQRGRPTEEEIKNSAAPSGF